MFLRFAGALLTPLIQLSSMYIYVYLCVAWVEDETRAYTCLGYIYVYIISCEFAASHGVCACPPTGMRENDCEKSVWEKRNVEYGIHLIQDVLMLNYWFFFKLYLFFIVCRYFGRNVFKCVYANFFIIQWIYN